MRRFFLTYCAFSKSQRRYIVRISSRVTVSGPWKQVDLFPLGES